jgi:hypothetical protein
MLSRTFTGVAKRASVVGMSYPKVLVPAVGNRLQVHSRWQSTVQFDAIPSTPQVANSPEAHSTVKASVVDTQDIYDVVIVGGGIAGTALACALGV